ncbi:MAG: hypothetical protein GY822_04080 [Deltaproteobacteria bacterium]|nr:hypothetical protein [Deltaproteobacteria bacterium]
MFFLNRIAVKKNSRVCGTSARGHSFFFFCIVFASPFLLPLLQSCAGANPRPQGSEGGLVDPTTGANQRLHLHDGKLWILDVCASWSTPCLVNARVLSEVCDVLCQRDDVFIASILLDENDEGRAYKSYKNIMQLKQKVRYADTNLVLGGSVLGPLKNIPRLVIVDKEGDIAEDITGGLLNAPGVIRRALEVMGEKTR